jgi:Uma2 family endonuclease
MIRTPILAPTLEQRQRPQPRLFTVAEYARMVDPRIFAPTDRTELIEGIIVVHGAGQPWRFSVAAYHALLETDILHSDERTELIEGEILLMSPINPRHAGHVNRLNLWLMTRLVGRVMPAIQNPVQLSDGSEPQPDVAVLRPRADAYGHSHPTPADVFWLIEVSDATIEYDCEVKVPLYARAGIAECWVIDVNKAQVRIYRTPKRGEYTYTAIVERGQTVSPLAFPEMQVAIEELLGED